MTQEVELHGGPWHGRKVSLEDGKNHFHIVGTVPSEPPHIEEGQGANMTQKREGMYSRVGKTSAFEWDGWRSCD